MNSATGAWGSMGKFEIRKYSPGIQQTAHISRFHNLNPDILHIPDIGLVHLC